MIDSILEQLTAKNIELQNTLKGLDPEDRAYFNRYIQKGASIINDKTLSADQKREALMKLTTETTNNYADRGTK